MKKCKMILNIMGKVFFAGFRADNVNATKFRVIKIVTVVEEKPGANLKKKKHKKTCNVHHCKCKVVI